MRWRRKNVDGILDAIASDRRPPRLPLSDEEAREVLAAASLRAGRPGADAPHPEFVEKLERRLQQRAGEAERDTAASPSITRRRLLGGAAAAAAAVAVGAGIDRVVDRSGENSPTPQGRELVPASGNWVDVAAVEQVPVGRPLRFSAGAIEGFVVNHGDRIAAVSALCTHMPCTLHLDTAGQRLDCPCHPATFAMDGTPMADPGYGVALAPLPSILTRVVDGRVQVYTA